MANLPQRIESPNAAIADAAQYLRGFYYFREEVLSGGAGGRRGTQDLPLPTSAYQVRPLLFLLDHLRHCSGENRLRRSIVSSCSRRSSSRSRVSTITSPIGAGSGRPRIRSRLIPSVIHLRNVS